VSHFSISAGIVGNRTEGIGGQGDPQGREHPHGSKADSVDPHGEVSEAPGETKSGDNGQGDGDHRNPGREHPHGHTINDGGRRSLQGLFGNTPGRLVFIGGEIFGRLPNDDPRRQSGYHGTKEPPCDPSGGRHDGDGNQNEKGASAGTQQQGIEEVFLCGRLFGADQENAENGEDGAYGCHDHGSQHVSGGFDPCDDRKGSPQCCSSQDRSCIGLIKVSAHASHVAHIIAHVVGNGGRVARVILGDAGFHLTYQVSAHIGRLGIDTAPHTGKERLRGSAHTEGQHRGCHLDQLHLFGCSRVHKRQSQEVKSFGHVGRGVDPFGENQVPGRDVKQGKPHNHESHYRSTAEGDLQPFVQRLGGPMGGTRRRMRGRLHPQKSTKPREKTSRQKGNRHKRILHPQIGQYQ